jgi:hypothetical protein
VLDVSPESPEARRKQRAWERAHPETPPKPKPQTRWFAVLKRVAIGVYSDGFIHAGNLAYLALLSIFPFVIVAAAVARWSARPRRGWTRSTHCCGRCRATSPTCCARRSTT